MNIVKIKINDLDSFLSRYKLVSQDQFKVTLTPDFEDGGLFDEDDYIILLCRYWFDDIEIMPAGWREPIEEISYEQGV